MQAEKIEKLREIAEILTKTDIVGIYISCMEDINTCSS
jgi:hypothetical protein